MLVGTMLVKLVLIDFVLDCNMVYFLLLLLFFLVGCFPHRGISSFGFLMRSGWTSFGGFIPFI